jgi:hypothetical protein
MNKKKLREIINNTRGGIEGGIWERGNGGKLKSRMNTAQFLGNWNLKEFIIVILNSSD